VFIQIVPSGKHKFYVDITYSSSFSSASLVPSSSAIHEDNTLLGLRHHKDEGSKILRNVGNSTRSQCPGGLESLATLSDNFDVLLTVHLSIFILLINQIDAQNR